MSRQFASGKHAHAFCDRCGFRYPYNALKYETEGGVKNGIKVCSTCWEPEHPQDDISENVTNDPQGLRDPRPDPALEDSRELF